MRVTTPYPLLMRVTTPCCYNFQEKLTCKDPLAHVTMMGDAVTNALKNLTLSEVDFNRDSKELGRGSYGRVFTVKYCGRTCAAKEIHSTLLAYSGKEEKDAIRKSFLRECYHCSNLRHPNIVQFIGIYWPEQHTDLPVMVMELMECNLTAFIDRYPDTKLKDKYSILRDVAYGLIYLHSQNPPVIHCDLVPNNVLMTDQLVAKISVAMALQTVSEKAKTQLKKAKTQPKQPRCPGTPDFMPPESFSENPVYNTSLDVFSYGGIILYVFTSKWPTPADAVAIDPKTRLLTGYSEVGRRQIYLSQLDDDLRHLAENCFDNDPKKRPVILKVVEEIKKLEETSKVCVRVCVYMHVYVWYYSPFMS